MASTAAAQQRKAVLLEARMRGLTGSEASSAFTPAQQTSLDPPVTEVGFRSPSTSREGVSTKPASGSSSMTGVLPPGAPAPREPSPLKRKAGDGMGPPPARRKSAQPRKLPTKRASSDGGDERLKSAEAKASGLSQELERVREAASKEGEATRQKLQLTRDALENALRKTAEDQARKARRDVADAAFELGRATYVAGSLGGRDAWEDGDAARRLKDREEELRRRREDETKVKRSIRESKKKGLDGATADEAAKYRARKLKKDEELLAGEKARLHQRKLTHAREWQRVRCEDASVFKHRPTLHGKYLLQRLLGKGGFSEVWLSYDLDNCRNVAVKFHTLDSSWGDEKKRAYVRHAAREYSIQRDLEHDRIVRLHDVFEVDADTFATVLEYCSGDDLDLLLRERGRLKENDAKAILLQILSGLKYLHAPTGSGNDRRRAIIHYDLKPGNILFDQRGDAKITDFGLSKIVPDGSMSQGPLSVELTSQGAGTYWYLPPECFRTDSSVTVSGKVDVWSVGVIFYQMLYGKKPFGDGVTQQAILRDRTMLRATSVDFPATPKISDAAKDFCRKCLAHSSLERPTVAELEQHAYLTSSK